MIRKKQTTGREEPTVFYCEEETNLKPGAQYGPVIRDIYIVECCTEGYGSVIINGKEFKVSPGSIYILLPGDTVIHKADRKAPRKGMWCGIDGLSLGRYFAQCGISSEQPFAPEELFDELSQWIRKMIEVFREENGGKRLLLTSYVYGFLATLLRNAPSREEGAEWVDRAIGLMESRYHENLSVSFVASQIGLDRAYFSTLFREKTGFSPHRYLTDLRIRKACGLLSTSDCSVAEVAQSVGIDARNFSRIFKKELGKTPLEYRSFQEKKRREAEKNTETP